VPVSGTVSSDSLSQEDAEERYTGLGGKRIILQSLSPGLAVTCGVLDHPLQNPGLLAQSRDKTALLHGLPQGNNEYLHFRRQQL
jgi:hypothetical protein